MGIFGSVISAVVGLMDLPITIYGFSFSFWQVFLFSGFLGILAWMLGSLWRG